MTAEQETRGREAWREAWEERAAIMEYDGKLPRHVAEAAALKTAVCATPPAAIPAAPSPSPAKSGAGYARFHAWWHSRNNR